MFCKNCGTELQENNKFCPNCGEESPQTNENSENSESKKLQKFAGGCFAVISGIVLLLVLFVFIISIGNSDKNTLKVVEAHSCKLPYGNSAVCGTIENTGNKDYSYAHVQINLYDKNGNQIGSTMDNINNLEAGTNWKFQAVIIQDNVADYKITNLVAQ